MKTLILLLTLSITISSYANADRLITAIGSGDDRLYAATKIFNQNSGFQSSLFEIQGEKILPINLPSTLTSREVVAIFREKERLFILSQHTSGDGDQPVLYEQSGKSWKAALKFPCISFDQLKIARERLTFNCYEEKEGKSIKSANELKLKGVMINSEISLPASSAQIGKEKVTLEGLPYSWDALKFSSGRTISSEQLR